MLDNNAKYIVVYGEKLDKDNFSYQIKSFETLKQAVIFQQKEEFVGTSIYKLVDNFEVIEKDD